MINTKINMKVSWKSIISLGWHAIFLIWTAVTVVHSIQYIQRVPLSCLGPWISSMGMGIGNLMIVSHFAGKLLCELFTGESAGVSIPGFGASVALILSASSYCWGIFLLANEKPDYCHDEIPQALWTLLGAHVVNGIVHLVGFVFLFIYRVIKCINRSGEAES